MKTKPNEIDQSLVHGEIIFRTHRDRCLYIGTSTRDQPKWLKDHPDDFTFLRDFQQEASSDTGLAENGSPVPAKAVASNSRTSAQEMQHNGKKGDAGLDGVDSGNGPSPRQSVRASVLPIADTASSTPPDKDEIVIGGRRYVSSKRLTLLLKISPKTLSRWCAAGKAPPKIKISGDYFELPEG
jgi:hypothetical protein